MREQAEREEQAKKIKMEDNYFKKNGNKKEKSSAKKEKEFFVTSSAVEKPSIDEIKSFFLQQSFPEVEAQKFFNYFSSVGWLVGGKTPMVDWQAAAQNWMLNSTKFNPPETPIDRAKHLNVGNDKDYSEPL